MLRPGHWSLHIGQGGPFDVPNVSRLRCGHRGERLGLDAEAKKQFWIVIVSGSALQMRGVGSSEHWSLCLESTKLKYYLATLTPRTLELV